MMEILGTRTGLCMSFQRRGDEEKYPSRQLPPVFMHETLLFSKTFWHSQPTNNNPKIEKDKGTTHGARIAT